MRPSRETHEAWEVAQFVEREVLPDRVSRDVPPRTSTGGAAPQGKARGEREFRAAQKRPKGGWSHPEGLSIETMVVGSQVEGTVTNLISAGAFINFGAQKDGFLPARHGCAPSVGDVVRGLVVKRVDVERNRVNLAFAAAASPLATGSTHRGGVDAGLRSDLKEECAQGKLVGGRDDCDVQWSGSAPSRLGAAAWNGDGTGGTGN